MRTELAERLLAEVMGWNPEAVARERPELQALALFKYDDYQQFSPGMRFVESLALWLNQFDSDTERKIAYNFIRNRLLYISDSEMEHFVSIAYSDYIRPYLISQVGVKLNIPETATKKIINSKEFRVLLRQSLFLGLSDGAHTDIFRRANNPSVTNEQVWQTYSISKPKAQDMLLKLSLDLKDILGREPNSEEKKFKNIFLLDDFSASGLSYFRYDPEKLKFAGKISELLKQITNSSDERDDISKLIDPKNINIYILFYVATKQTLFHLHKSINKWLQEKNMLHCSVEAIQVIPNKVRINLRNENEIISLLLKYFDTEIVDGHYRKGKCEKPYLGFNQCALPLILYHNTPNNSIPLLWFDQRKYRGLFPRVSRHKE